MKNKSKLLTDQPVILLLLFIVLSVPSLSAQNVQIYNKPDNTYKDFFPLGWYTNIDYKSDTTKVNTYSYLDSIICDGFSNTLIAYQYEDTPVEHYYSEALNRADSMHKDLHFIVPSGIYKTNYPKDNTAAILSKNENIFPKILGWYLYDEPSLAVISQQDSTGKHFPYPSDIKKYSKILAEIDTVKYRCLIENTSKNWYRNYSTDPPLISTNPDKYLPKDSSNSNITYGENSDLFLLDKYTISKWDHLYFNNSGGYKTTAPADRKQALNKKFPLLRPSLVGLPVEIHRTLKANELNEKEIKPVIAVLQAEEDLTCLYKIRRTGIDSAGIFHKNRIWEDGQPVGIKKNDDGTSEYYIINTNLSNHEDPVLPVTTVSEIMKQFIYKIWTGEKGELKGSYLNGQYRVIDVERGEDLIGNRGLHFEEILYNTYTSLVHGAKGILFYGIHRTNEDMKENIKIICKTLQGLNIDEIILTDEIPVICNKSYNHDNGVILGDPYDMGTADDNKLIDINQTLRYNRKDRKYYLIVTNDSQIDCDQVEMTLPFKISQIDSYEFNKKNHLDYKKYYTSLNDSLFKNDNDCKTSTFTIENITKFQVKLFRITPDLISDNPSDRTTHPVIVEKHAENISKNTVWMSNKIHRIYNNIEISSNATLTIEQGAIVVFDVEKEPEIWNKIITRKITVNGKLIIEAKDITKPVILMNPSFEFKNGSSIEDYKNIRIKYLTELSKYD